MTDSENLMEKFASAYTADYTTKQEVKAKADSGGKFAAIIDGMGKYNPLGSAKSTTGRLDDGSDLEGNIRMDSG